MNEIHARVDFTPTPSSSFARARAFDAIARRSIDRPSRSRRATLATTDD